MKTLDNEQLASVSGGADYPPECEGFRYLSALGLPGDVLAYGAAHGCLSLPTGADIAKVIEAAKQQR